MIYVDRHARDENGTPIRPDQSWRSSAASATRLAIREGPRHNVDEAVYKHDLLQAALERLFEYKCAYCESPLEEVGWNVEHFRPKGRVAENRNHAGYRWLAYAWENLYPSCMPCNLRRRDKPIWGDLTAGRTAGKYDQFPLEDENTRVFRPPQRVTSSTRLVDHARKERALLIDPCWDTPSWYLTFDVTGQILAVGDNSYGESTIEVCHLKRRRLRRKREIKIGECIEALKIIQELRRCGRGREAAKMVNWYKRDLAGVSKSFSAVAITVRKSPSRFGMKP